MTVYLILYRTPKRWRTTVAESPKALACGALRRTSASASKEDAVAEFEELLSAHYGVAGPRVWRKTKPDWWVAEVVPGALESAGEGTNRGPLE